MPENSTDEVNGTPLVQGQRKTGGQLRPEIVSLSCTLKINQIAEFEIDDDHSFILLSFNCRALSKDYKRNLPCVSCQQTSSPCV